MYVHKCTFLNSLVVIGFYVKLNNCHWDIGWIVNVLHISFNFYLQIFEFKWYDTVNSQFNMHWFRNQGQFPRIRTRITKFINEETEIDNESSQTEKKNES